MTTNRLARSEVAAPRGDPQHWIDRGNRLLWGEEPTSQGEYLKPRRDLEWRCKDGFYFITSRAA